MGSTGCCSFGKEGKEEAYLTCDIGVGLVTKDSFGGYLSTTSVTTL
jgi:hypothetical protein